jgi:hypothetical protein
MLKKLHFETRIKLKSYENKRKRKSKGQSRTDNPETLATSGTTQKTKQTSKHGPCQKTGVKSGARGVMTI